MLHVKNPLFDYKVVCDESNNSSQDRDAKALNVEILIPCAPLYTFRIPIPKGIPLEVVQRVLDEMNDEHNQLHAHH